MWFGRFLLPCCKFLFRILPPSHEHSQHLKGHGYKTDCNNWENVSINKPTIITHINPTYYHWNKETSTSPQILRTCLLPSCKSVSPPLHIHHGHDLLHFCMLWRWPSWNEGFGTNSKSMPWLETLSSTMGFGWFGMIVSCCVDRLMMFQACFLFRGLFLVSLGAGGCLGCPLGQCLQPNGQSLPNGKWNFLCHATNVPGYYT